MKRLLFSLFIAFSTIHAWSQYITGKLVDDNNNPVAYANVILVSKADSIYAMGTVTSEKGLFNLTIPGKISFNEYLIKISHIGFQTMYVLPQKEMATNVMQSIQKELGEVVVTGHRTPFIKMNNGKLHVNIQHTILSNTGNSIEVLSQLPFISKTSEGISVFGRGTPLIYIDNRKVQNMDELQKLSSDEVKNIEVNLHPGAEYGNNIRAVVRISTIRK